MPDFTISRLRGGFAVSWIESGKRRRFQLAARSRKEAEAEARDIIRRETAPRGGMTIAALWDAYRADRDGRPIAAKMKHCPAVLEFFGHLRPDQITPDHGKQYETVRAAQGIKPGSIWTEIGHVRTVCQWAAKPGRRLIAEAPTIDRPKKPAPRDRWLTREEAARLIGAAETPHIRLAIILLLATAARTGAVLDLTWDRVDFERRQIDYRLDQIGPRKGRAVAPMNAMAAAALQTARAAALSPYVIEWAGGRVACIRKGFQTAVERAGLVGVTQHDLRHTAAVHLVAARVPMSKVSQMLGHSNESITSRVYARYAPDHLREEGEILDFTAIRSVK